MKAVSDVEKMSVSCNKISTSKMSGVCSVAGSRNDFEKKHEVVLPERLWNKYSNKSATEHHRLVEAIFKQIELKDMNTANHSRAVAYYSECIGLCVGLGQEKLELLKDAALLHDTGKIMVDLVVLNKKRALDARERLQMQRHAELGMRALSNFHLSDEITDAAWHHHERWDGSGYPDGLQQYDIPMLTRIVSISDALEAMSAQRPYSSSMSPARIMQELAEGEGKQFDPLLANVVQQLLKSGKMKLMG